MVWVLISIIVLYLIIHYYSLNKEEFFIGEGERKDSICVALHYKKVKHKKVVTFYQDSIYDTKVVGHHFNKLFGFSYLYHHWNSVRIGWRPLRDRIELCFYLYKDGNLIEVPINFSLIIGVSYEISLIVKETYVIILIEDPISKITFSYTYNIKYKPTFGYMLYPYFGGNPKAPNDILIVLEK
jgi:hypothetical protein